jgi:hypothetical protein
MIDCMDDCNVDPDQPPNHFKLDLKLGIARKSVKHGFITMLCGIKVLLAVPVPGIVLAALIAIDGAIF